MTYLSTGVSWLLGQLNTQTAETVTYKRGAATASIKATATDRDYPGQRFNDKVQFDSMFQAWVLRRSELILSGVLILPQRGDRIEVVRSGSTVTYEVLPDGEQVYKIDQTGQMVTVYTREL